MPRRASKVVVKALLLCLPFMISGAPHQYTVRAPSVSLVFAQRIMGAASPKMYPPGSTRVERAHLRPRMGFERNSEGAWVKEKIDNGEGAFPELINILSDPASETWKVTQSFVVLYNIKSLHRQPFIPLALARLDDEKIRDSTLLLVLGEIGSEREAVYVLPYLRDKDITVSYAAVEALGAIGGERELAALGSWLDSSHRYLRDDFYRRRVIESLNAINKRLAAKPKGF